MSKISNGLAPNYPTKLFNVCNNPNPNPNHEPNPKPNPNPNPNPELNPNPDPNCGFTISHKMKYLRINYTGTADLGSQIYREMNFNY